MSGICVKNPNACSVRGGAIGCELAPCFARLDVQVIQVEMAAHLLFREDEALSQTKKPMQNIGFFIESLFGLQRIYSVQFLECLL